MERSKVVLAIDDDELVRGAMLAQLAALGYTGRGAEDGARGLAEIRRERPDLVVCDLRMPRMDGLEFLAIAHAEFPDLPVIVISGAGLLGDAVGALKLGAWDYLEKPIRELAVLEHAVSKALERSALLDENRRHRIRLEELNAELTASLRLLAEDEEAGRQLQFRMLPQNHLRFGAFEVSHEIVPSAFLSGDFVDVFSIDARHFGFYLADVSGHGVPSALVTVLLRSFVQRQVAAYATNGDLLIVSPSAVLERLNDEITKENLGKHVTIFYGVIDLDEDTLVYANAGQFPWPLLFDGKGVVELEGPGFPIGLVPRSRYREHRLTLPRELVLAAFSDGLLEILPHQGLAAKREFLRAYFGRREITIERFHDELRLDDRRPLPDDVAVLLVKRG